MARCRLAFDQGDASSLSSEGDRNRTACHSTTDDQYFVLQSIPSELVAYSINFVEDSIVLVDVQKAVRHVILYKSSFWSRERGLDGGV